MQTPALSVLAFLCLAAFLGLGSGCDNSQETVFSVSYAQNDGPDIRTPSLPDISGYTVEKIVRKSPPSRPGVVRIEEMKDFPDLAEFLEGDTPRRLRLIQKRIHPRALVIQSGNYNFFQLYDTVRQLDEPDAIVMDGDTYTLRMPLLISANASLTISDIDAREIRLSRDNNAFIANSGDLFILRTKITGWDEKNKKPSDFVEKHDFRPFITTWSGSHMYIAGADIASLGYLKGKSYGLSYSTCSACLKKRPDLPRPTGAIVASRFSDMYYGFYSYEADDVAIVGNVYADNIIYGIDPHDRSRRLIIAENETYGSKKKHGIIVSREVNDSWIFNNHSHDNHGSGIMIDRTSINNIVANNISVDNGADGITFFESQNNTTFNNTVLNNKRSGIRIRNSWNVKLVGDQIAGNNGPAVDIYTAALEGQETRDFELDPYTRKTSAEIVGMSIRTPDKTAAFKVGDEIDSLKLSDIRMTSSSHIFADDVEENESTLFSRLQQEKTFVEITPRRKESPGGVLVVADGH